MWSSPCSRLWQLPPLPAPPTPPLAEATKFCLVALPRLDEQTSLEIETQIRSLYTSTLLEGQPDRAKHQGIAFAVELFGGMRLAAGTIGPGVTPGNWTWIERKINTGESEPAGCRGTVRQRRH